MNQSGNLTNVNPKVADPVHLDFRLLADSPAIDAGVSNNSPDHDYDGIHRPQGQGPDIGAYEFH